MTNIMTIIQGDKIQYKGTRYNTRGRDTIREDEIQYEGTRYNTRGRDTIRGTKIQYERAVIMIIIEIIIITITI